MNVRNYHKEHWDIQHCMNASRLITLNKMHNPFYCHNVAHFHMTDDNKQENSLGWDFYPSGINCEEWQEAGKD